MQNYRIVFFPDAAREFASAQQGSLDYKVSGSAWKAFQDSAIISTAATFFSVVFGTLAAYSIVRFRTGGETYTSRIDLPDKGFRKIRVFPPRASVDFDGDGRNDLMIATDGSHLKVYRGKKEGGFEENPATVLRVEISEFNEVFRAGDSLPGLCLHDPLGSLITVFHNRTKRAATLCSASTAKPACRSNSPSSRGVVPWTATTHSPSTASEASPERAWVANATPVATCRESRPRLGDAASILSSPASSSGSPGSPVTATIPPTSAALLYFDLVTRGLGPR